MNSVYESLRALLRNKELEIKRLEKEIEALRIVLPIVAEAGDSDLEEPKTGTDNGNKAKVFPGPDFNAVMAQAKAGQPSAAPAPAEINSKTRTSWP